MLRYVSPVNSGWMPPCTHRSRGQGPPTGTPGRRGHNRLWRLAPETGLRKGQSGFALSGEMLSPGMSTHVRMCGRQVQDKHKHLQGNACSCAYFRSCFWMRGSAGQQAVLTCMQTSVAPLSRASRTRSPISCRLMLRHTGSTKRDSGQGGYGSNAKCQLQRCLIHLAANAIWLLHPKHTV